MEEKDNQSAIRRVNTWYNELPNKKKYLEVVTAFLSIPVLVTVIISNVSNIRGSKQAEITATPTPSHIVQYIPNGNTNSEEKATPSPSLSPEISPTLGECKKEVGPVDISYPNEGAIVTENPVTVVVSYHPGEFCAAVWAYRINGGPWSQFDDKSIALYGMTAGEKRLELKVKSIASGAEVFVSRNFSYEPPIADVQSATGSATPQ